MQVGSNLVKRMNANESKCIMQDANCTVACSETWPQSLL